MRDFPISMVATGLVLALTPALHAGGFLDIASFTGGNNITLDAVSGDGFHAVGTTRSDAGIDEAFRWSPVDAIAFPDARVLLGDLDGSVFLSNAFAASSDGSTVVGRSLSTSGQEAFRWTQPEGMIGLGDLDGGGFQSRANGVSADGSVIVGEGLSIGPEAFRWTQATGPEGLGYLPGGNFSGANAVNPDGSVVVGFSTGTSGIEAFRWTQADNTMIGLDVSGSPTATISARDVSTDGTVVVGEGIRALTGPEAFRWSEAGGLQGLGDLPTGDFSSEATGVSADGSIVVGSSQTSAGNRAFIWDQTNGMRNLASVLTQDFNIDLQGATLVAATGISDDGRVIVGNGTNGLGNTTGWAAYLGAYWYGFGGNWDSQSEWFFANKPTSGEDTVIKPSFGQTITGPEGFTHVGDLDIDARESGRADLKLASGPIIASGLVSLGTGGGLTGSGTLTAQSGIDNHGRIALDPGGQINGQTLTNHGQILAGGDIFNTLINTQDGEIRAQAGQTATFHGNNSINHGRINLLGGLVEFAKPLTNAPSGHIAGRGTLTTGGLTNQGQLSFSAGFADILGGVDNQPTGLIRVFGASTTTFFDDVDNAGSFDIDADSKAIFLGTTSGVGSFLGDGTVEIKDTLAPGNSSGQIDFAGNLRFGIDATLALELADPVNGPTNNADPGQDHDRINVTAHLTIDGTLNVTLIDDYDTTLGDTFTVMTWDSRAGMFDTFQGVVINPDGTKSLAVEFDDAMGEMRLTAAIPGDANLDGIVSIGDLSLLASNFNQIPGLGNWRKGDFNQDGQITIGDLSLLASNFGQTNATIGSGLTSSGLSLEAAASIAGIDLSTVPEPNTVALLTTTALLLARRRHPII